ncbi:MAG TPA: ABC transporter permease [candidate division Zixibacteria bacterium]|nr:ABC transporter permease [candidate division Zixibacteria bacterium]
MGGLTRGYVLQRFLMFLLTIWLGSTLIFFIPRLAPGDPISAMVNRISLDQGYVENAEQIIATWKARFGLADPLWVQYIRYWRNISSFDFGYSLARFPTQAWEIVRPALPWSVGLLSVATILSFLVGVAIGALMGWRRTPRWLQIILPTSLTFASIPYFMFGIVMIYVVAFQLGWLPSTGAYSRWVNPGWNWAFITDMVSHAILPVLSIVLTSMGGWALGMRGLMISVNNEDYFLLAQVKGLSPVRIFFRYGVRNAILPAVTALAMGLGGLVSGSILVEFIFAYPGTGYTLYESIVTQDYTVTQAIANLIIFITAASVLLLDLLYPLIDPRISYRQNVR